MSFTDVKESHESKAIKPGELTSFSTLIDSVKPANGEFAIVVPPDWLQGRTAYGGLSASICLECAIRAFADLPPLRSAQFCFIGPATGELRARPQLLRRGKSAVHIGVDLVGESGLALRASFCFGSGRSSVIAPMHPVALHVGSPEESQDYFTFHDRPNFMNHFEGRLAGGTRPCNPGAEPEMSVWLRHRDEANDTDPVRLLALADALPPATSVLFDSWIPISTMTWSIDMMTDRPSTDSGWWLIDCQAETIGQGYSVQNTAIWNRAGEPILLARQNVAVFG